MRKFIFLIIILIITCIIFAKFSESLRTILFVGETYVPDESDSGLVIIDITDPENAFIVEKINFDTIPIGMDCCGNALYVAGNKKLRSFDITDPYNVKKISEIEMFEIGEVDVCHKDKIAYVSDWTKGMFLVDVSDKENMKMLSEVCCPIGGEIQAAGLRDSKQKGDYVFSTFMDYTQNRTERFMVFDVSDKMNPKLAKEISVAPYKTHGIDIQGNYAYLAGFGGLVTVDISDPPNSEIVSKTPLPGGNCDIHVCGNYAYLCQWSGFGDARLLIVDVSNPENPVLTGTASLGMGSQCGYNVMACGDYCYIDHKAGVGIVNIADKTNPSFVKSISFSGEGYEYDSIAIAKYINYWGF